MLVMVVFCNGILHLKPFYEIRLIGMHTGFLGGGVFIFYIACFVVVAVVIRMGKTTLLDHIAERKLAIPPRIDVLLCEQEVVADDTPAIDAVLKADKERLRLLAEEKELMAEANAGNDTRSDRLKQVGDAMSSS